MSMIFEISTFKLARISSKILDTNEKFFLVELCNQTPNVENRPALAGHVKFRDNY